MHTDTSANTGVILLWQGIQYPNNSILNIEGVGKDEHSLICQTDKRPCCGTPPHRFGEWYYPDGRRVPIEAQGESFYRNRGDGGLVRLNRRNNFPIGFFCCEVPDANDVNHTLCMGLLPIGGTH